MGMRNQVKRTIEPIEDIPDDFVESPISRRNAENDLFLDIFYDMMS